jgi:ABC-type nickel/cobalt efflux system permease component RcnA
VPAKKYKNFLSKNLSKISSVLHFFSLLLLTSLAFAHPLGNFSVNRYSLLELSLKKVDVYYVVDMAEVPTLQERAFIDVDQNGTISGQEHLNYLNKLSDALQGGLELHIDGRAKDLKLLRKELTFPEGQGGLPTLRLSMNLTAELPSFSKRMPLHIRYRDVNYSERLGWKEIVARPAEGVVFLESNVPDTDISDALREYPEKKKPFKLLNVQTADITVVPRTGSAPDVKHAKQKQKIAHQDNEFTRLIKTKQLTLEIVIMALAMSFGLGAVHALSPGHGKSIAAAYLVGSRGTVMHAFFLGITVTLTHTLGVFLLGFIALFAFQYMLPEKLYPWLSVLSGLIVFSIGAVMLAKRWKACLYSDAHFHQDHVHRHTDFNQGGKHFHDHDHLDHHEHENEKHKPPHGHIHVQIREEQSAVTWKSLLGLGVSGGILPCPSALVVLLAAISMHRVGFGLILILAFSIGLASVLTGIGLMFVKARQLADRISSAGPVIRVLPAVSASVIMVLGIGIALNACRQLF